MEIKQIRLKSPNFEAVQITADNLEDVAEWCRAEVRGPKDAPTLLMRDKKVAELGWWVVSNPRVEGYEVASPYDYSRLYEPVTTVRCQFCKVDKPFDEMAKRTDGMYSAMCTDCENKELEAINRRRESLAEAPDVP